ncbi:hypothetical protein OEZ86_012075 [Tetradesmus obliquus]|nr:hypothetical protein OEZ86_012075 [Tetradesmus obliquus]
MPLYELLCLARPLLPRDELGRMIQKVGSMVYSKGGVITNVHSYGEQNLAYKIKGVQGKFDKAQIWQLNFAVSPEALQEINMAMRVNEDILRWVVVKRGLEKMPSHRKLFHQLSEYAEFLTPPTRQQGGNLGLSGCQLHYKAQLPSACTSTEATRSVLRQKRVPSC